MLALDFLKKSTDTKFKEVRDYKIWWSKLSTARMAGLSSCQYPDGV